MMPSTDKDKDKEMDKEKNAQLQVELAAAKVVNANNEAEIEQLRQKLEALTTASAAEGSNGNGEGEVWTPFRTTDLVVEVDNIEEVAKHPVNRETVVGAKGWLKRSKENAEQRASQAAVEQLGAPRDTKDDAEVEAMHSKFVASGSNFAYDFHSLEDFFGGLERYIGPPSTDVRNAMSREHASDAPFDSHNVRSTSLRQERASPCSYPCINPPAYAPCHWGS